MKQRKSIGLSGKAAGLLLSSGLVLAAVLLQPCPAFALPAFPKSSALFAGDPEIRVLRSLAGESWVEFADGEKAWMPHFDAALLEARKASARDGATAQGAGGAASKPASGVSLLVEMLNEVSAVSAPEDPAMR